MAALVLALAWTDKNNDMIKVFHSDGKFICH